MDGCLFKRAPFRLHVDLIKRTKLTIVSCDFVNLGRRVLGLIMIKELNTSCSTRHNAVVETWAAADKLPSILLKSEGHGPETRTLVAAKT